MVITQKWCGSVETKISTDVVLLWLSVVLHGYLWLSVVLHGYR